jgi:hypothetical protein
MKMFGIKNKLYVMIGSEYLAIDIGRRRIVVQWLSAEDGITPYRRIYTFQRQWEY